MYTYTTCRDRVTGVAGPLSDDAPPDTPLVLRSGHTHEEYMARIRAAGDVLVLQIERGGAWASYERQKVELALRQQAANKCGRCEWCKCSQCTGPPSKGPFVRNLLKALQNRLKNLKSTIKV